MTVVNVHQAKTELSKLIARVEAGEEIVISRHNVPVVKMVPLVSMAASQTGRGWEENKQAEFQNDGQNVGMTGLIRQDKGLAKKQRGTETGKLFAKNMRAPGRFAHLRGKLPIDLFSQPLSDDELAAWEGKYSGLGAK